MKTLKARVFACAFGALLAACSSNTRSRSATIQTTQTASAAAAASERPSAFPVKIARKTLAPSATDSSDALRTRPNQGSAAISIAAQPAISPAALPTISPMQTLAPGTPTPVPTPTSDVPMLAPNAAPQIIAVSMNRSVASAGQILRGAVTTSSNVASVEMRVVTYSVPMTKTAVGHFIVAYAVPKLPFFLRKTYTLQIIARNTAGLETSRDVPLTIR